MSAVLRELRASWLAISLLLVAGALFFSAATGSRGIQRGMALEKELVNLNERSFRLMQQIDQLQTQLGDLGADDRVLEELARQRLHMVRPGDTLYRIGTKH